MSCETLCTAIMELIKAGKSTKDITSTSKCPGPWCGGAANEWKKAVGPPTGPSWAVQGPIGSPVSLRPSGARYPVIWPTPSTTWPRSTKWHITPCRGWWRRISRWPHSSYESSSSFPLLPRRRGWPDWGRCSSGSPKIQMWLLSNWMRSCSQWPVSSTTKTTGFWPRMLPPLIQPSGMSTGCRVRTLWWCGLPWPVMARNVFWIPNGVKINQYVYLDFLMTKVAKWITDEFPSMYVCFAQDGVPAHSAGLVQDWCQIHFEHFWEKTAWPPSSPDANSLDFAM